MEKMEPLEVDSDEKVPAETMIGLIDDCKEIILQKLDLSDLLNIADSSKILYPMACQVFKAKYSNRRVTIDNESGNRYDIYTFEVSSLETSINVPI